jgi:hypothetical protein
MEFERAHQVEERFHKDFDGVDSPNDKSANDGKMNVLSIVVDTIATISAILHFAWCGLHL